MNEQGATRRISHADLRSVAVRCAQLRVVRGRDKGKVLDFGVRRSAVLGTGPDSELVLTDDSVSFRHAELRAEEQGYLLRDLGSTNGTRASGVRVGQVILDATPVTISLGETDLSFAMTDAEVQHPLSAGDRFQRVLARSEAMQQMFAILERATTSGDSTILLEGESGTGKELIAEAIHAASPRAGHPFQVLDCGSIPPSLIESELFGARAGAFTGATRDRSGAIEEAASGTLFLDEIGELPLEMQPKLLRALERKQIRPVGGTKFVDIDFRVIAATNRNLRKLVDEGKFRGDLYYRLAVVQVEVPALRHRREDIPLLAQHFLSQPGLDAARRDLLTPSLLSAFAAYDWPGNVRELRNAVERLVILGDMAKLPTGEVRSVSGGGAIPDYPNARRAAIERFERDYCRALLDRAGGVVAQAAAQASISRQMFHRLLRKHGIDAS